MSVLDLFRNQNELINEEEERKEEEKEEEYEEIIQEERNEEILKGNGKDGNIENTCLFSKFIIEDVQGWKSFIHTEESDTQWPSINTNILREIKRFHNHSSN